MKYYVMVTSFENHWDNLPNSTTTYSKPMIRFGNQSKLDLSDLVNDAPTIFIKRLKNGALEKAWLGNVSNFNKLPYNDIYKIQFKVLILQTIDCPPVLINKKEGWYYEEIDLNTSSFTGMPIINIFEPPFFSKLKSLKWEEFEEGVMYLLRSIGLHMIYGYDRKDQSGKPDGVFKIDNTIVIYDCTLRKDLDKKSDQIDNYIARLKKNKVNFGNREIETSACDKYVFIITTSDTSRILRHVDDIIVKEIPVKRLLELYFMRLSDFSIDEKKLEKLIQEL